MKDIDAMEAAYLKGRKDCAKIVRKAQEHEFAEQYLQGLKEGIQEAEKVHWMRPGPCPITPEQFNAIYDDKEDEG